MASQKHPAGSFDSMYNVPDHDLEKGGSDWVVTLKDDDNDYGFKVPNEPEYYENEKGKFVEFVIFIYGINKNITLAVDDNTLYIKGKNKSKAENVVISSVIEYIVLGDYVLSNGRFYSNVNNICMLSNQEYTNKFYTDE